MLQVHFFLLIFDMNLPQLLKKIQAKSRWLANDLRAGMGWKGSKVRPLRCILCYHGIDERGETQLNSRFLSQSELRRQLEWMAKECKVLTLEEYFSRPFEGDALEICLSFDDGYRNNFDLALPLLEEFGFPASFFVTAAHLRQRDILWPDHLDLCAWLKGGKLSWQGETYSLGPKGEYVGNKSNLKLKNLAKGAGLAAVVELEKELENIMPRTALEPYRRYWELMGEAQLRSLAAHPLIELGTHGVSHANLGTMQLDEAKKEMVESKTWLEALTGRAVSSLAWPFGTYTRQTRDLAYQLGYERILSMGHVFPEDVEDSRQAPRMVVNPHVSFLNQREAILKGRYL